MEYLEGRTLGEILQEQKRLPAGKAVNLFKQVLGAIDASYRAGIVHRDLKPMNLMITNEGIVKVMDFGLAKLPSFSLTSAGTILGTPYYMSPEQITGRRVDIRSDIFSIGAVLYQTLTGARPFEADTSTALAYMIVNVEPVPPNVAVSELPESLCEIIRKAMAKDPAERYQTPGEMLKDLVGVEESIIFEPKASQFGETVISEGLFFNPKSAGTEPGDFENTGTHPVERYEPAGFLHEPAAPDMAIAGKDAEGAGTGRPFRRMGIGLLVLLAGAVAAVYLFSSGLLKPVGIGPTGAVQKNANPQGVPYEGKYQVEGTRPNGSRYQGTATLTRSGERFSLTWNIDNQAFSGSGALSGNRLSINWSQGSKPGGLIIYTVNPNGNLSAVWGDGKGTETLVPIR
jgi:serine/threonine protein kinase